MPLTKLSHQLRLMALLSGNTTLGIDEVAARLGLSRRSVYRYIEAFRDEGFVVTHSGDIYCLDKGSPFFRQVSGNVLLSEAEAAAVLRLITGTSRKQAVLRSLRDKLARLYDYGIFASVSGDDGPLAGNISLLYEAVRQHLTVVLRGYRSLRSETVTDRIVEPYCFLSGGDDIRCYELSSGQNKTFRLSRIGSVKLLDVKWSNAARHDRLLADDFGFTGEPVDTISLRLSPRAAALLGEECPHSTAHTLPHADGSADYTGEVCSYLGPARFVLGLFEEIDVKGSTEFIKYLRQKAKDLTEKFSL